MRLHLSWNSRSLRSRRHEASPELSLFSSPTFPQKLHRLFLISLTADLVSSWQLRPAQRSGLRWAPARLFKELGLNQFEPVSSRLDSRIWWSIRVPQVLKGDQNQQHWNTPMEQNKPILASQEPQDPVQPENKSRSRSFVSLKELNIVTSLHFRSLVEKNLALLINWFIREVWEKQLLETPPGGG